MKKDDMYKACSILATMFTILGISIFNISPAMFFVIISVCIVVIIKELNKIYSTFNKIKQTNRYNSKKCIEQRFDKAKKVRDNNICIKSYSNIKIAILIMIVITIATCIKNYKVMIVYANKIFTTIEKITSTEPVTETVNEPVTETVNEPVTETVNEPVTETVNEPVTETVNEPVTETVNEPVTETVNEPVTETVNEPVTETVNEPVNTNTNTWTKFKLEYPEGYPWIDDNEYNNLYREIFYSEDVNGLNEIIKSKIVVWLNSCASNTPLDNVVTSDEKSITYFLEIESNFSNKGDVILSSDLLDEVIMGRKELLELYPNGTSAWILANHMQTYALNYLYQSYPTKDEKSIMYLYMKAINYTQKSLEFEMDISKKCERISYIQSRYKDIAECKIVNTDIRLRAYEIYTNIQEELNELQIS